MNKCAARAWHVVIGAVMVGAVLVSSGATAHAQASLSGSPDPLDFGPQRVGTTSSNGTVVLSNSGDATNSLTLSIINDPNNEFAIVAPIPTGVPGMDVSVDAGSNGTADVFIQFTPTGVGVRTAQLQVAYTDPPSTTFTVDLQGTGTTAPTLEFDQASPHTFADTMVGGTSATLTVNISNTGTETLDVTSVQQIGAECTAFTITVPSSFSIPSDTPQLEVSFSPTARQSYTCTIRFTGNQTGSTTDFVVQGTGIGPELEIVDPPTSHDFGIVHIGDTTTAVSFTLRNIGETTATVNSAAIAGVFGSQYIISGFTSGAIAPLGTETVDVQFAPTLPTGAKNDNVEIDSDSVGGPLLFPVMGEAGQRIVGTSAPSIAFMDVTVLTNSDQLISITNTGTAPLQIDNLVLTNTTDFSLVSPPGVPFPIAGGGSQSITVRCTPATAGDKTGSLQISSNGDNQTLTTVSLTCRGVKPDITLMPNTDIDFGDQTVSTTSTPVNVTVSNANLATTSTLTLSIAITGTHAGNFQVTPASCRAPSSCNIAAGGSQVVSFTFTPSALNTRNAIATFTSNDLETPSIVLNLTGNGTRPEIDVPTGALEDFGNQRVTVASTPRTITASNVGNEDLVISNVTITGGGGDFTFTGPTSVTIPPGGNQDWQVTFTPSVTGNRAATFSIANNDTTGGENPKNVSLSGVGTESDANITFTPAAFPQTLVGDTSTVVATLSNNGTEILNVTNLTLSHSEYTFTAGMPALPIVLAPGNSTNISLTFIPVVSGDINGSVTVVSDDPNTPESFPLLGPGRVAGINALPMTVSFGDVRIDGVGANQIVTVENSGTAGLTVTSVTINNTTDFSISYPGQPGPVVLAPGASFPLTVTTLPASTGTKMGTITITTDSTPSTMISISSVGVIPEITLSTPTVSFGPKDVQQAGAITENAVLENTGTDDLTITDLSFAGSAAAEYRLASSVSLPIVVATGETLQIPVEYDPAFANANHAASLTVVSDAQGGDISVTLMGVAIDRFISVPMTVTFPDTQRNPEEPTVINLPITNTGDATLDVISVQKMAGSDPSNVFAVVSAPDDVPGPAPNTQNATLSFSPTAAAMFNGTVVIANDDDQRPSVQVTLAGLGFVPRLALTPMIVDFGRTGVGVPVRASETNSGTVTITNMESFPLVINSLRVVRTDGTEGPFTVLTPLPDQPLAPGESLDIDLQYAPTEATDTAGDTGRFEVLVNADPEPVAMVNVRGEAVDVRLRGGGCAVSGDGAGAGGLSALLVLAAALLGLRRRRLFPVAVVMAVGLGVASPARADITRNLDLRTFNPVPAVEAQMFAVESPLVGLPNAWSLAVYLNHAMNPLTVDSPQIEGMTDSPITARTAAELAFSYAFGGKYEAGLLVPVMTQSGNTPLFSGVDPAEGSAIGDIALHAKALLVQAGPISLGASATITVPTATAEQFAGANGPSTHARAMFGINSGRIGFVGNAGFRARGSSTLADVDQGNELTYGVAGAYRLQDRLTAIIEVFGAFGLSGTVTEGTSPLEATWGVRYRLNRQIGVAAGVGRGLMPGIGAPEFRAFALLSYSSMARDITPVYIPPPPRPIDRGDNDGDGVINEYDKCPDEPEDKDGFKDEDGCPDPDNDGDGVPDKLDKCPNEPEDKDGFKDEDGCPDPDNDKDGIPDKLDKCPNEPEDKDGFEDEDGCDDPDNDKDGIPDLLDQCATEPETINGNKDDDGCPDQGNSLVMLMPDRLEMLEPIRFIGRSDRIAKRSHNVLGQVAAHLRARREFIRIRIAAHVHKRNRMDQQLSLRRAQAVRKWLTQWGIEPERLEVKAYGSSRPLLRNNSAAARTANNRVEFILLEKKIERRK